MIHRAREEHKTMQAGLKVESSILSRYYCQDATGKYASIKGVSSFFFFFFACSPSLSDKIYIAVFILIHSP